MMGFLKNNFIRILSRKNYVITSFLMTVISISFAVYYTTHLEAKMNIAWVTQNEVIYKNTNHIKIFVMEEEPALSQLILGKYDGVIIDQGNGDYDIKTIKNKEFRETLVEITKDPEGFVIKDDNSRGLGTNIIGFLMMFILLQSVLFMFTLAEDIERKQIERILTAPVSFSKYLTSHLLSAFVQIFLPAFLVLVIMKIILDFDLGFNLLQFAFLIGLLLLMGLTFALFINSIIKGVDKANMMGSAIILLTTLLSGSFYAFDKGNAVLEKMIWILPQKSFLSFVENLEKGSLFVTLIPEFIYIIFIIFSFFIFSILKIKKDYIFRRS